MSWDEDYRRQQDEQRRKAQEEDRKRADMRRQQQLKAQRESDQAKRAAAAIAKKKKEEHEEFLEKRKQLSAEYDQINGITYEYEDQASSTPLGLNRGLSNGLGGFAPPKLSANSRSKPAGPFQGESEGNDAAAGPGSVPKQPAVPPLKRYGF